jgi:putative ABC transport system permease protein
MVAESIRLALGRLRANVLRSALTVLGVVIGVGAIVTLVAVGRGSANAVSAQFAGLGADTLTVSQGRGFSGGLRGAAGTGTPLSFNDAATLARDPQIASTAPIVQRQLNVSYGGVSETTAVQGTTPGVVRTDHLTVATGAFFSSFANAKGLRVAVLGATLASDLNLSGTSAPGTIVQLGNTPFVVIGVLEPQGGVGFLNPDGDALIPMQAMLGRLVGSNATVSQIRVQAKPGSVNTFGNAVEADMRAAHNLSTTQADDFLVINPTTIVAARKQSSTDFTRLITAIAAISLVVGGIGIANVMLVAVRERTREIGVRRALGARRRDVLVQFLTEATVLSAVGGGIGVLAGLGLAYLLPSISSQQTSVSYLAALLAFAGSGLVGVVAGVGPANQAAALEPASALRYE